MRHALLETSLSARLVLTAAALIVATPAAAATVQEAVIKPIQTDKVASRQGSVRYFVRRSGDATVLAHVDYEWRLDGAAYELRSVFETEGMLAAIKPVRTVMESRGEFLPDGLRPHRFSNEKKKRTDQAQFDWKAGTVSYRDEKAPLAAGSQDLLSLYAQLAWLPPREAINVPVATGSKVESYRINVEGEEKLGGGASAVMAVHVSASTGTERIDLWLPKANAAALMAGKRSLPAEMPLPVRIRVADKSGIVLEQSLDAPPPLR